MKMRNKITFSFYTKSKKLAGIIFHFDSIKSPLEAVNTKDFLFFYTILQVFLRGELEEEKATFELETLEGIRDGDKEIPLIFDHFGDFVFKKISENNTQYLSVSMPKRFVFADREEQSLNIEQDAYKKYIDTELSLIVPKKPLRLRRFQAQYYFNILQKVSYSW